MITVGRSLELLWREYEAHMADAMTCGITRHRYLAKANEVLDHYFAMMEEYLVR